ncbi:MAG: Acylphosphatase [Candidatus Moranbacteria bacterium GW2011_GWE1_49_15]|nr:MAG: Acylphosphatase [Candidatus Moranbacteria bacterium GW2011_GWE2_47_10]KKW07588.1 MAG: Acylphosphatase [Candidatus Moranbacteria bacterium GW2011_GWE1_49_15]HBP01080.1 acylphosphatase [Candidatus Moranbacteria bacterium]
MKRHLEIKIFGKVQGVLFRASAKKKAEELSLFGYAKNLTDGTVEIQAEGERKDLDEFLKWCREGPDRASVERVDFEFSDAISGFEGFEIS